MQNRLSAVKESQASYHTQLQELRAAIEAEKAARPQSVTITSVHHRYPISDDAQAARNASLSRLTDAHKELEKLEGELAQYGACDPVKVDEKKRAVTLAKEAAVRWTGEPVISSFHSCSFSALLEVGLTLCGRAIAPRKYAFR